MPAAKTKFEVGNWVRGQHAGFWQVYRVARYQGLDPISGKVKSKTTVFVKRFVSDTFKQSFTQETCDPSLLMPLSKKDFARLQTFILDHQALYAKFVEYQPPAIDAIYNARIVAPKGITKRKVEAKVPKDARVIEPEIDSFLRELGYSTQGFPCLTVQFISPDHQLEDRHLVYRFHRVLDQ